MGHLPVFHLVVVVLVATAFATPLLKWKSSPSTTGTSLVQEEFTSGGWILEKAFLPGRCVYPDFDVQNDGSIRRKWTFPGGQDEKAQVDLEIECTSSGLPYIYYDGVKNAEYLAVLLHGNGMDISETAKHLPQLAMTLQANIIALEYPGYGQAPGKASRDSVNQAVWDFVNDLKDNQDIDLEKLILMGQSIGTGVAAKLARRIEEDLKTTIAGLVLISPYTSCADMVKAMTTTVLGGAVNFLTRMPKDWWNTVENVKKISCPYIVLHGSKDTLIPPSHGVAVAKANHGTLVTMQGLGHNNMYLGLTHPKLELYRNKLSGWRKSLGKKGDDSDNGGKNGDGELKRELLKMDDDVEENRGNVEEEVELEGGDTKKSPILDRDPTEEEENQVAVISKKGDDGDDSNQDTLTSPKEKQTIPLILTTSSGVDYKGSGKQQCTLVREPMDLIYELESFKKFSKKLKRRASKKEKIDYEQEKRDHAIKRQAAIAKANAYKAWQKKNQQKKKKKK